MVFKNYRLNIVARSLLLGCTVVLMSITAVNGLVFFPIAAGAASLIQIFTLIRYTDQHNNDLTAFIDALRYADFSVSFPVDDDSDSFNKLHAVLNRTADYLKKLRSEREEQYFFLQNVTRNIDIGIIAFSKNGDIKLINDSAEKIFKISGLTNINELKNINPELAILLSNISSGQNKLFKSVENDDIMQLSISAAIFTINSDFIKLVSIKNISPEMNEGEMESWQKLVSVLTHEIINSITPVSSLISTVNDMVADLEKSIPESEKDNVDDIKAALNVVVNRSNGLIKFVETYRNLTKIPKPNFSIYSIKSQFDALKKLTADDINSNNINLNFEILPEDFQIIADRQLIEQVLINLIRNSIQAFKNIERKNKTIRVNAYKDSLGRCIIKVYDNGCGILDDVKNKIFIPFFTTKPEGSGIGLSLSRQILRMHSGGITVNSTTDKETEFTVIINN